MQQRKYLLHLYFFSMTDCQIFECLRCWTLNRTKIQIEVNPIEEDISSRVCCHHLFYGKFSKGTPSNIYNDYGVFNIN